MFVNVNVFRENDCFSSVCLHSRKMIWKIFYIVCLEQRKTKQRKKPTPKTTGIHQKWEPPLPATQTHPATHREPNPHRNQPKTHSATHRNSLHKTKNQTPNQPNPINFDPPETIKPITGKTITQNRQQSNPWQIW